MLKGVRQCAHAWCGSGKVRIVPSTSYQRRHRAITCSFGTSMPYAMLPHAVRALRASSDAYALRRVHRPAFPRFERPISNPPPPSPRSQTDHHDLGADPPVQLRATGCGCRRLRSRYLHGPTPAACRVCHAATCRTSAAVAWRMKEERPEALCCAAADGDGLARAAPSAAGPMRFAGDRRSRSAVPGSMHASTHERPSGHPNLCAPTTTTGTAALPHACMHDSAASAASLRNAHCTGQWMGGCLALGHNR